MNTSSRAVQASSPARMGMAIAVAAVLTMTGCGVDTTADEIDPIGTAIRASTIADDGRGHGECEVSLRCNGNVASADGTVQTATVSAVDAACDTGYRCHYEAGDAYSGVACDGLAANETTAFTTGCFLSDDPADPRETSEAG